MENNKLYANWVSYLKKNKLYPSYKICYARANEYESLSRDYTSGEMKWSEFHERIENLKKKWFTTCVNDVLLIGKGPDISYDTLKRVVWKIHYSSKMLMGCEGVGWVDWNERFLMFSREYGYIPKLTTNKFTKVLDDEFWISYSDTSNSRVNAVEPTNTGHWYDHYYDNDYTIGARRWRRRR